MKRISTHILDLSLGKPAGDVPVRLGNKNRQETGVRTTRRAPMQTAAVTSCSREMICRGHLSPRVRYGQLLRRDEIDSLYPIVEVTFQVRDGESHFHIPLLLTANGYTTYRGT